MKKIIMMLCLILAVTSIAVLQAKQAQPMAADPVLEKRVMALSEELRCLVCQNQTLADSDSGFARDMREEVRSLMRQGLSDDEVVDYLVARYGDFIRFRPPVKGTTVLLWLGPLLLLLIAAAVLFINLKRRGRQAGAANLSAEDHRRAERLLGDAPGSSDEEQKG